MYYPHKGYFWVTVSLILQNSYLFIQNTVISHLIRRYSNPKAYHQLIKANSKKELFLSLSSPNMKKKNPNLGAIKEKRNSLRFSENRKITGQYAHLLYITTEATSYSTSTFKSKKRSLWDVRPTTLLLRWAGQYSAFEASCGAREPLKRLPGGRIRHHLLQ